MEHLIETNGSEEHIAIVRESLKSEGWKDLGNKLPKLWLFKTEKHSRQLKFLTERGNLAISKIGPRKYLEEDKEDLKYHEGDEDNVVRRRRVNLGMNRTGQMFLSPDGQMLNGKRSVLRHMIRRNFSREKITAMRYLLKYDGWAFHPGLPHNWMYKFSANKLIFWSPEGKLLESRDKVHQFIKCEGGANAEEDMKKVQSFNVSRSRGKKEKQRNLLLSG